MKSNEYFKKNSVDGEKFKTTDFYLSVFLIIQDQTLQDITSKPNSDKKFFVFEKSSRLKELVESFYFADDKNEALMVSIREVIPAIRQLKDKLYNPTDV